MTFRPRGKRTSGDGAPPPGSRILRVLGLCSVWVVLLGVGWGPHRGTPFGTSGPPPVQAQSAEAASDLRQRQAAFLHRMRQADPRAETITRAVFNTHNELGVILTRHVEMDAVRPLLRTLLTQMARAFPRQDLTVIAYAPSEPPLAIGTARLNARTREMTYTPAVPQ
jgi:hypothetical protein